MTHAGAPSAVARVIEEAGLPYAIIGGHAVNAWLEPRFTADVDITVVADGLGLAALDAAFREAGYSLTREYGAELPSGPDFVRWVSVEGDVAEVQLAKTDFQREVVRRAVQNESGARVASPEDLIVLKLIADRAKDRIDLQGLAALPDIDWAYVEGWAREWDVLDRLDRLRGSIP